MITSANNFKFGMLAEMQLVLDLLVDMKAPNLCGKHDHKQWFWSVKCCLQTTKGTMQTKPSFKVLMNATGNGKCLFLPHFWKIITQWEIHKIMTIPQNHTFGFISVFYVLKVESICNIVYSRHNVTIFLRILCHNWLVKGM